MTARLARILRHPVKAIGHEDLPQVTLTEGRALPFDRHWAVAHVAAKFGERPEGWAPKMNFLRGVAGPELMCIASVYDEAAGRLNLTHPRAGSIEIDPEGDAAPLIDWLRPLWPASRPEPARLVSAPDHALTDQRDPFVSLLSLSSLEALSARAGQQMSPHRFRGNLWVEGWEPFAEQDLIGARVRIGEAELTVAEPIIRCAATEVNPETGVADVGTLKLLGPVQEMQRFGVFTRVTRGGRIAAGDPVERVA